VAESTAVSAFGAQKARRYLLLACGTAVSLSFGLHAVAPALPLVQDVFGLSDFEVGLVTSAYVLPGVVLAVPLGVLADLAGRRRVFAAAGVLYGLAGAVQGWAPSFDWLLAGRLVQGVAFAALMPLTVTVLGDAFSGLAQVRAQAQRQVTMAVAQLAMPVLGAQLAAMSWFLPFWAQAVSILPGLWALWVLDDRRGGDVKRVGYVSRAATAVRRMGFPSVLFLNFMRFFARFAVLGYLPLHLTRQLDASLIEVGMLIGVATGVAFVSAMAAARVSAIFPPSRVVLGALLALGSGLLGFSVSPNLLVAFAVAVAFALGDGLIAVLGSAYAAAGTPDNVRAGVVALDGTARNAGKFVGPLAVGAIATATGIAPALAVIGAIVAATAFIIPAGLIHLDHVLRESQVEAPTGRGVAL
jgi:MFS transporter, ACDE family, multidrug resistance protein